MMKGTYPIEIAGTSYDLLAGPKALVAMEAAVGGEKGTAMVVIPGMMANIITPTTTKARFINAALIASGHKVPEDVIIEAVHGELLTDERPLLKSFQVFLHKGFFAEMEKLMEAKKKEEEPAAAETL